jgi:DNA-binding Xre family transcriptional regulator
MEIDIYTTLKVEMAKRKLTQQEVAERVGKHNGTLWSSIRNESCKIGTLKKVCASIGISLSDLFTVNNG